MRECGGKCSCTISDIGVYVVPSKVGTAPEIHVDIKPGFLMFVIKEKLIDIIHNTMNFEACQG